ncbi:malto-oligosyltrehalose synthase [Streptomyces noursei]|uniref:malto-oligosyltrehalose synthase n=1 Tax=Streptomyces noursei TaxID=1971 RepID=UPI001679108C|nr:malto-oligosyltrehalose synthase [Streptomyces noursei]MCZ1018649.1 malto-oligosyltrehalose synthase [Streptomyces noursei]GGX26399.1 malto-oligosyltrehalose synthase [Streptomyces noursei]
MTQPSSPSPTATYRLQLQPDFPFAAAERAVPYLAALGVSHLHLSPVLEAVPGSTHGYDVTGHAAVRAELGGEEGLRALAATARAHGLGLVVDIVPNHMAVPAPLSLNGALWEVLRDGPASRYARWFDVDWDGGHRGRLLLPVLEGRIGDELPRFRVERGLLHYGEQVLPLRPGTELLPLPRLLEAQWYRLAWWRLARTELNYRRFFTISELIGIRVEDPEVFDATHGTVLRLIREGVVDGLRVDHPDGLVDPGGYLARLRAGTKGCWTVVEKILTGAERLPDGWACAGTTGYDALRHIDGLFVCPQGAGRLFSHYRDFVTPLADEGGDWDETVRRAAYEVVEHDLAAEVERLVRTAARIGERVPRPGDHAPWALRQAVRELLVRLPVYRPYAGEAANTARAAADAAMLRAAAERARATFRVPEEAGAVDLVHDLVLGRFGYGADGADDAKSETVGAGAPGPDAVARDAAETDAVEMNAGDMGAVDPDVADFAARFAQTASALHAKSVEDTAFYRYPVLLSACEVGGDPGEPALGPGTFHEYCARLQRDWPESGTVLSTHDTKRSADVRARIAVLSECPDRWRDVLNVVADGREVADGAVPVDPLVAWSAWQTAFGLGASAAGGPTAEQLTPAVLKAVREAGLRTTWTEPDAVYEEAVAEFVRSGPCGPAADQLAALEAELAPYVRANVLAATLLHLTMPGVPDLYQDTEREYAALVDPDNRRPARCDPGPLAALDGGAAPAGLSAEKLRLTATALRLRRAHPEWFGAAASYEPLSAEGPAAEHCVAFVRAGRVVTAVTRLSLRLQETGGWWDTGLRLPAGGDWRELLTGRTLAGGAAVGVDSLLTQWPVALLVRE